MASNAIPMNDEDRAQLREIVRRAGGGPKGAAALGVSITTLARAIAGMPVQPFTISYIRLTIPRTLEGLPGGPGVERTG